MGGLFLGMVELQRPHRFGRKVASKCHTLGGKEPFGGRSVLLAEQVDGSIQGLGGRFKARLMEGVGQRPSKQRLVGLGDLVEDAALEAHVASLPGDIIGGGRDGLAEAFVGGRSHALDTTEASLPSDERADAKRVELSLLFVMRVIGTILHVKLLLTAPWWTCWPSSFTDGYRL